MQVVYRSRSQELREEGFKEGLEKARKEAYEKISKIEQETQKIEQEKLELLNKIEQEKLELLNKIKQEKLEQSKKIAKLLGITLEELEEKLKNIPKDFV